MAEDFIFDESWPEWTKSDIYGIKLISDVFHFVDPHTGETSVRVDQDGIIWLKEDSNGTSAWYGIDNRSGQFDMNSRFYVQWLHANENQSDWNDCYAQLDDKHKAAVEDDRLWIFQIGVQQPDGTDYTTFDETDLYIQIGDDWDPEDLTACFISSDLDEAVDAGYQAIEPPSGMEAENFAVLRLEHFSPYAIYDAAEPLSTDSPTPTPSSSPAAPSPTDAPTPTPSASPAAPSPTDSPTTVPSASPAETLPPEADPEIPQTGDESNVLFWSALACISLLGMMVLVRKQKEA